jgi:endoglucanase
MPARPLACLLAAGLAGCSGVASVSNGGADGGSDAGSDGGAAADGGGTPDGNGPDGGGGGPDGGGPPAGWLYTSGNHLYLSNGTKFHGRGANIHDTRSCNACTASAPSTGEVIRRIDELVDVWKASFIRFDLESYADNAGYRVHWKGILDDPGYLADVQTIVAHIASKPGLYAVMALWIDPTVTTTELPTAATNEEWKKLAQVFANEPRVIYGLTNEPHDDTDANVWDAMNATVAAIRGIEDGLGTPHHVISVQGTQQWARYVDYYLTHPITAGNGANIVYETHVYNPQADFAALFENPSKTLPMIIGEYGPAYATLADCQALMADAEQLEIPYLAWTFHMRCDPNLLVDNSSSGCGVGMTLTPAPGWGQAVKDRLAVPW